MSWSQLCTDEDPAMPLDPDAMTVLEMIRVAGRPPYEAVGAVEARRMFKAAREILAPDPAPVAMIRDLEAPRPDGGHIPLRLYRGLGTDAAAALPVLVYFHGGGWVIGDIESHDPICRHLANAAGCAVVSVDYRLAPEHKFPAAVEDCTAATAWVAEQGAALGVDPDRLAVGGDSAGGNLAAVVCLFARDRGGPRIVHQLLIYPAVDAAMDHPSIIRFAEGHLLTRATMEWFYAQYLRGHEDIDDWRASPLRAADLGRLPAALVVTCGYDPLCDEGDAYARRLERCGVPVRLRHHPDQIHGFWAMGKIIKAARTALDEAAAALVEIWQDRERGLLRDRDESPAG
jgi:acetyl esterase